MTIRGRSACKHLNIFLKTFSILSKMGELDHLNEVLIKINENLKDLNVSLLKSLNGEYFIKVKHLDLK